MTKDRQEQPLGVPAGVSPKWHVEVVTDDANRTRKIAYAVLGNDEIVANVSVPGRPFREHRRAAARIVTAANRYPEALALLEKFLEELEEGNWSWNTRADVAPESPALFRSFLSSARTEGGADAGEVKP